MTGTESLQRKPNHLVGVDVQFPGYRVQVHWGVLTDVVHLAIFTVSASSGLLPWEVGEGLLV